MWFSHAEHQPQLVMLLVLLVLLPSHICADILTLPEPYLTTYEREPLSEIPLMLCSLLGGILVSAAASTCFSAFQDKVRARLPGVSVSISHEHSVSGGSRLGEHFEPEPSGVSGHAARCSQLTSELANRKKLLSRARGKWLQAVFQPQAYRKQVAKARDSVRQLGRDLRTAELDVDRTPDRSAGHLSPSAATDLEALRQALLAREMPDFGTSQAYLVPAAPRDGLRASDTPFEGHSSGGHLTTRQRVTARQLLEFAQRQTGFPVEALRLVCASAASIERLAKELEGRGQVQLADPALVNGMLRTGTGSVRSDVAEDPPEAAKPLDTDSLWGGHVLEVQCTHDGERFEAIGAFHYAEDSFARWGRFL